MIQYVKNNPLKPWYISVVLIVILNVVALFYILNTNCGIPGPLIFGFLVILPAVYLALMYLTLKKQN